MDISCSNDKYVCIDELDDDGKSKEITVYYDNEQDLEDVRLHRKVRNSGDGRLNKKLFCRVIADIIGKDHQSIHDVEFLTGVTIDAGKSAMTIEGTRESMEYTVRLIRSRWKRLVNLQQTNRERLLKSQ